MSWFRLVGCCHNLGRVGGVMVWTGLVVSWFSVDGWCHNLGFVGSVVIEAVTIETEW